LRPPDQNQRFIRWKLYLFRWMDLQSTICYDKW